MKKLFFLAATAMLFAACTNEEGTTPQQTAVEQQGVGFDVYVPGSTQSTRSGRTNVMTTSTLQMTGFGVLGYWHDGEQNDPTYVTGTSIPNFMYNQQVSYNKAANGWYYSPLKYWPNETGYDSQTTPAGMPTYVDTPLTGSVDRLSFFAYAPWTRIFVDDPTTSTGDPDNTANVNKNLEAPTTVGITAITRQDGKFKNGTASIEDPQIHYVVATDPNQSVDLLWGTAPVGGLSYTAVNKEAINIKEGMPLVDLVKPAVNTNLKFLFQHALARLGVKIVLAADQVAAGGDFDFGSTKVTVEKIEIRGNFGLEGDLNLKNTVARVPNWKNVRKADGAGGAPDRILTIANGTGLAPHLVYDPAKNTAHQQQTVTGVVTEFADAIKVSSTMDYATADNKYVTEKTDPDYSATTPFFNTWQGNYNFTTGHAYNDFSVESGYVYFYKTKTNNILTSSEAFTVITPSVTYPTATYWKNIFKVSGSSIAQVTDGNISSYGTAAYKEKAYRCIDKTAEKTTVGATFYPTHQIPEIGDWIFDTPPTAADVPELTGSTKKYVPVPNYFMVIPTNYISEEESNRSLYVKITYWVSTKDPSLDDGILYVRNVVDKKIVLPNFKNGMAYNLKIILGMTSVKLEAEMEEWQSMTQEINLPQNISE